MGVVRTFTVGSTSAFVGVVRTSMVDRVGDTTVIRIFAKAVASDCFGIGTIRNTALGKRVEIGHAWSALPPQMSRSSIFHHYPTIPTLSSHSPRKPPPRELHLKTVIKWVIRIVSIGILDG
jgi:hypothetical protein